MTDLEERTASISTFRPHTCHESSRHSDLQATRSALLARDLWSGFPVDSADELTSTWMSDARGRRQSSSTKLTYTTVVSLRYGQNRPGAYITR